VENSFRFPSEVPITSREIAEKQIQRTISNIRDMFGGGGRIEKLDAAGASEPGSSQAGLAPLTASIINGGHGHGASVRYRYTDPYGRVWRAEWDGIQRDYIDGKLVDPHGGHVEVPSPKYVPKDAYRDIKPIFDAARANGQTPKRSAGGGHMNTDLAPIKALPDTEGPQKIKSLIGYYESNREMITFLWQHPRRAHAARPIELPPGFAERLAAFNGDWNDLARFLWPVFFTMSDISTLTSHANHVTSRWISQASWLQFCRRNTARALSTSRMPRRNGSQISAWARTVSNSVFTTLPLTN
jgi:hypothetical protein